jgi:hypothetical protein
MSGMEGLGKLFNIVPNAISHPFKLRGASGVAIVAIGSDAVITIKEDSTFGGSFSTTLATVKTIYWTTASDGTAAWSKLIPASPIGTWTHGTTTGLTTAVVTVAHVFTSMLADPNSYIKITATGTSPVCYALPYDLTPQRAPANLEIQGA